MYKDRTILFRWLLKSIYLAFITYAKASFMKTVFFLFCARLWHIHVNGQELNCDIKNVFKRLRRFVIFIYGITPDNAFILWPAFLHISSIWASKVSLWSIFIPSNFSHLLFVTWLFSSLHLIIRKTFK